MTGMPPITRIDYFFDIYQISDGILPIAWHGPDFYSKKDFIEMTAMLVLRLNLALI
jgi:hypothetical protein